MDEHSTGRPTRNRLRVQRNNMKNTMFQIYKSVKLSDSQSGYSPSRTYTNGATYTAANIDSYSLQITWYITSPGSVTLSVNEYWS